MVEEARNKRGHLAFLDMYGRWSGLVTHDVSTASDKPGVPPLRATPNRSDSTLPPPSPAVNPSAPEAGQRPAETPVVPDSDAMNRKHDRVMAQVNGHVFTPFRSGAERLAFLEDGLRNAEELLRWHESDGREKRLREQGVERTPGDRVKEEIAIIRGRIAALKEHMGVPETRQQSALALAEPAEAGEWLKAAGEEAADAAEIPGLIGALNADFTTRRDPGNLAANRGARVGKKTMLAFGAINDQSVAAFLDSPRKAREVLQAMVEDGALSSTDLPGLYDFKNDRWLGDGKASGKNQVEQALFGAILPDSRLLDEMTDGMRKKLLRALPALIRLKKAGSPELASLTQAMQWLNELNAFREGEGKGLSPAAALEAFRKPATANMFTGETAAEKAGPAWDMLRDLAGMKTQKAAAEYFLHKADEAAGAARGLFEGFGQSPRPEAAEATLRRDARAFAAEVDRVAASGKTPLQPIRMLQQTPLVLQLLGQDARTGKSAGNREMRVSPHTFQNIQEGAHGITFDMLKQIPEAMADSIMVFDSDTHPGDLVFMLELTDANGATVVVPVALEAMEGRAEINVVKSAYAKETDGVPNNDWFRRQVERNTRYANQKKLERWQQTAGVQFPVGVLRNAHGNTIRTDSDLVKLRSENSGIYQAEAAASDDIRGSVTFHSGVTLIRLFRGKSDFSTVLHEMGHVFLRDLENRAAEGKISPSSQNALDSLRKLAGGEFNREGIEKVARNWEAYLREGKAPSPELVDAFSRFRGWLTRIYRDIRNYIGQDEVDAEVRDAFDHLLASEEEIRQAREYYEAEGERLDDLPGLTPEERAETAAARAGAEKAEFSERDRLRHQAWKRAGEDGEAVRGQAEREIDGQPAYAAPRDMAAEGGISEAEAIGREKNTGDMAIAEARLREESQAFAAEVDKAAKSGVAPGQAIPMLRSTPLVLRMLGKDARTGKGAGNREMWISPHTFQNIQEGAHGITWDMLKQIPEAMADPIMIFDSDTKPGDMVFMLELTDANGATIVAPVALEAKEGGSEVNIVKSVYAKETDRIPNNSWFRKQGEKNTRYVNRKKIQRWQQVAGVQFPVGLLRNAHGNTIRTEADLVKLRNENQSFYQSGFRNADNQDDQQAGAEKTGPVGRGRLRYRVGGREELDSGTETEADRIYHNGARLELFLLQREALERLAGGQKSPGLNADTLMDAQLTAREAMDGRRAVGNQGTPGKNVRRKMLMAIQAEAAREVEAMPVIETDMRDRFVRAERKAGREAARAAGRGDYAAALEAMDRRIQSHAIVAEMYRAEEEADSFKRRRGTGKTVKPGWIRRPGPPTDAKDWGDLTVGQMRELSGIANPPPGAVPGEFIGLATLGKPFMAGISAREATEAEGDPDWSTFADLMGMKSWPAMTEYLFRKAGEAQARPAAF